MLRNLGEQGAWLGEKEETWYDDSPSSYGMGN